MEVNSNCLCDFLLFNGYFPMNEIAARIFFGMKLKGINSKELAQRIGIDPCTLSRKQKDPSKYTLAEINRIERVLKMKILEVAK